MVTTLPSSVLIGMSGHVIEVEVDIARGFPAFTIVGLPDTIVKESKERIRTAIKNAHLEFPERRLTVNFVPANLKKDGSHLDLPIALGVLRVGDDAPGLKHIGVLGELGLSGQVIGVKGVIPLLIALQEQGISRVIVPRANLDQAKLLKDMTVYPVEHLQEAYKLYESIDREEGVFCNGDFKKTMHRLDDFSEVSGQEHAKRALEIAASGGHHVLMMGPPGSGKTMLARRVPGIMPDLAYEEVVELTKVYSVSNNIAPSGVVTERPFRSPHHTISSVSLCGGGTNPKPGEVTLAHRGVLFLDELPEFKRSAIESLRQPIEDRRIQISRSTGTVDFPCYFTLIGAFNPCPCGYLGDIERQCKCSPIQVIRYLSKLSGPMIDRFDMQLILPKVPYDALRVVKESESSRMIKERVEKTRLIQLGRYEDVFKLNAHMTTKDIKEFCSLNDETEAFLKKAYHIMKLSARSLTNILKLSRTIADMDGTEEITLAHVSEALQYRRIDKEVLSDV